MSDINQPAAHEDPVVVEFAQRIDAAASQAESDRARGELMDYLTETGKDLALGVRSFDRSHLPTAEEDEYEQWKQMHEATAELRGLMWAAETDEQASELQDRINALTDAENWPDSWHRFEAGVENDELFWQEHNERADEVCQHALTELEETA